MQKIIRSFTSGLLLLTCIASANPTQPKTKFATNGPHELRQLVVPGFAELPLERRLLIYYLTEAIEAGRDIAWLQLSRNGLRIRQLFEQILEHRDALSVKDREAIESYYFLLVANHGVYDANTNSKTLLTGFTVDSFLELLQKIGLDSNVAIDLIPDLLDPDHKPHKFAESGKDPFADSGIAFYGPGITKESMDKLEPKLRLHPYSYPVLEPNGNVRLQIYRKSEKFGEHLARVDALLAKAAEYANPGERRLIEQYRKVIRTGDPEDALEADRIWVQLPTTDLTFHIGFTETYDDPLEVRPTWEGVILLHSLDPQEKAVADRVRASAPDYEKKMPVAEEFKNVGGGTPPQSEAAFMVHMAGGNTETFFLGVNLPNDNKIRETLGSKSFTVYNRVNTLGESPGAEFKDDDLKTFYLPQYHALLKKHGATRAKMLQVQFHEILGHGSGRDRDGVHSDTAFGDLYTRLEESRAELASLYHMTDYKSLIQNKLLPDGWTEEDAREFAKVTILNFFTSQLNSYRNLKGRTVLRQAHQVGRQIILNHLLNEGALKVVLSEDKVPRIQLASLSKLRWSLGRLWKREQEIKSTGDVKGLGKMMDELAVMTPSQIEWAKAITDANEKLDRAEKIVTLNPFLNLVTDKDGKAADVEIEYLDPDLKMDALPVQELRRSENDKVRMCRAFGAASLLTGNWKD